MPLIKKRVNSVNGKKGNVLLSVSDVQGLSTTLTNIDQKLTRVNQLTNVVADSLTVNDSTAMIGGNVLLNDNDPDNDTFVVTSLIYNGFNRALGQNFNTVYGTMQMSANGSWNYVVNNSGFALNVGQSVSESFSYRVIDSRGGISNSTMLTVTLIGTNQGPIAIPDVGVIPLDTTTTGDVLSNDVDYEGNALSVVAFSYNGNPSSFTPGETATIPSVGSFTILANGTWSFTPAGGYTGAIPLINYVVSDGNSTTSGTLTLIIQQPAATYQQTLDWFADYYNGVHTPINIAPNPVVGRSNATFAPLSVTYPDWDYVIPLPNRISVNSQSYDFRVGPGMEYETPADIPWLKLIPGDRVFIYYRTQPYNNCIPLHVRGEPTRWIEIIGVKGPNGEMPTFTGVDAIEDADSQFNNDTFGAGIVKIGPPSGGNSTYKPGFIHVHGLKFIDIGPPNRFTNYVGANQAWGDFSAGVQGQGFDNVTVSGCEFVDSSQGIFVICNPGFGERLMSRYFHMLLNKLTNNGMGEGREVFSTHNAYIECYAHLCEMNYFGPTRQGNEGDLIKDRSTGQVFRYNTFVSGAANAISVRDPEATYYEVLDNVDSFGQVLYDYTYIYSNNFYLIKDGTCAVGHGDGPQGVYGEVRGRGKVYFYNNVVVGKCDSGSTYYAIEYKPTPFQLFTFLNTRTLTSVDVRNNLLYSESRTPGALIPDLAIFYWQGFGDFFSNIAHNVRPVFLVEGAPAGTVLRSGIRSTETMISMDLVNTNADQRFLNFLNDDFTLLPDAPFYDLNAAMASDVIQRGLEPQGIPILYPFNDIPAPSVQFPVSITGNTVVGNTLSVTPGGYSPLPDTRTYQFKRDGVPIVGATGMTYLTVEADIGKIITVSETATNVKGSVTSNSVGVLIISATTPQIVTPPVITGSRQITFPLTVSTGTWSTTIVSYAYEWRYTVDNSPIPGQTTNTFTPDASFIGDSVYAAVYATGTTGETGLATSAPVTIIDIDLDPDVNNVYNFAAPNGTLLSALDPSWKGKDTVDYGLTNDMFECLNGRIVLNQLYMVNNGSPVFNDALPQSDDQQCGATFDLPANDGMILLSLQSTATNAGYRIKFTATNVSIDKNGANVYFVPSVAHNLPAVNARVKIVKTGTFIRVYGHNNELLLEFNDIDNFNGPIYTGGYPGFALYTNGVANKADAALDTWTAQPNW